MVSCLNINLHCRRDSLNNPTAAIIFLQVVGYHINFGDDLPRWLESLNKTNTFCWKKRSISPIAKTFFVFNYFGSWKKVLFQIDFCYFSSFSLAFRVRWRCHWRNSQPKRFSKKLEKNLISSSDWIWKNDHSPDILHSWTNKIFL